MSAVREVNSFHNVKFFPIVHLLTGPPGLSRNGGIWKMVKASMKEVNETPAFMVQAMHFTTYSLSQSAWEEWGFEQPEARRLTIELKKTFGNRRDIFLDSGGFQLLHSEKVDLSKWNLELTRENILELQLKYNPNRIASLDSPISLNALPDMVNKLGRISIENASWLLKRYDGDSSKQKIYLAVHGRTPDELLSYLGKLWKSSPAKLFKNDNYGLALGSQVPLSRSQNRISSNILTLLGWMKKKCPEETPLHVFGVGDSLIGSIVRNKNISREISYDNSTYAQSAFRLKVYDPTSFAYNHWNPHAPPDCACWACERLRSLGEENVSQIMNSPAYRDHTVRGERVTRSDVLAYIALHNMTWWEQRVSHPRSVPAMTSDIFPAIKTAVTTPPSYSFPLRRFRPESRNLLILPCTRTRPYFKSPKQKRVIDYLARIGLRENRDYDRVTVSGLYGPVHWRDETNPAILSYDFELRATTSKEHIDNIRFAFSSTLNVIRKKYDSLIGFLSPRVYVETFGPVIRAFDGRVVGDLQEIPSRFAS